MNYPITQIHAMRAPGAHQPLALTTLTLARLHSHEVLLEVAACGVCRTDLHLIDGELPAAQFPVTPGHEIVGRVVDVGMAVTEFKQGDRVGVPWLGWSCGDCDYCRRGLENLCDHAQFTGCTRDGGYADFAVADARYCLPIPVRYSDTDAAPLLCAGLIGYRAYRAADPAADMGRNLGLYGFGAAAHILAQIAKAQGRRVFAFTRPGDVAAQQFARELGAAWAGDSGQTPPEPLDAAILFAPVGALVPMALRAVRKGGRVVCAGIHMSDIPSFPYHLLWGERSIASVANLTREDGREFMKVAATIDLHPAVDIFSMQQANEAIVALRNGTLRGAAVLSHR
jgi:alcohol dehydrogenase, propanol-preferring